MDQDLDSINGEVSDDMATGKILVQGFTNQRPSLGVANATLPTIQEDAESAVWIYGVRHLDAALDFALVPRLCLGTHYRAGSACRNEA
jgi:hypothetical protein